MENLILLLTASSVLYRKSKNFRTTHIGKTGCSVLHSPEAEFDYTRTEEGDELYFAEHSQNYITYGVLCARIQEPMPLDEAREVMTNYLNRLQAPFAALYNTGITPCASWDETDTGIRLEDYWQDENNLDWKVKGYTDGQTIAVLYVKNINDGSVARHDSFLDSFSFGK